MEAYQQRVVEERGELVTKLSKLRDFLVSENALRVPEDELERLKRQANVMANYADILQERIKAFR